MPAVVSQVLTNHHISRHYQMSCGAKHPKVLSMRTTGLTHDSFLLSSVRKSTNENRKKALVATSGAWVQKGAEQHPSQMQTTTWWSSEQLSESRTMDQGASLAVQCLRFQAPNAGGWVPSLVEELRFHMPLHAVNEEQYTNPLAKGLSEFLSPVATCSFSWGQSRVRTYSREQGTWKEYSISLFP